VLDAGGAQQKHAVTPSSARRGALRERWIDLVTPLCDRCAARSKGGGHSRAAAAIVCYVPVMRAGHARLRRRAQHFVARKQQIGQVELVAALLPYLSLVDDCGRSRLVNKRCLHWSDNSSAVAARMKGYSA
jgi:hypothetical protein